MFGLVQGRGRSEHPSIQKRRAVEAAHQNANVRVAQLAVDHQKTHWEVKSNQQGKTLALKNISRGQKLQQEQALRDKRQRLAAMLAEEEAAHRAELSSLQETSEQRHDRLMERARNLKEARGADKKGQAQEAYRRQWRDGCDDLRTLESDRFRMHCHEEISLQRKEKLMRAEHARRAEARWADVSEQGRQELEAREARDIAQRTSGIHDNRNALLAQMDDGRRAREEQRNRLLEERRSFNDQLQRDADDARAEAFARTARKREIASDTRAFNMAEQQRKNDAEERRRAEEQLLLDVNLKQLQREVELKSVDKRQKQREIKQFRDFQATQRDMDRKYEAEIDAQVQRDLDAANARFDQKLRLQEEARRKLHQDVYAERERQIAEKERRKGLDREQNTLEAENLEYLLAEEARIIEAEEAAEREAAFKHRMDLEKQIQKGRMKKTLGHARTQLDKELADQSEAQYRAFLEREQTSTRGYQQPNFGLKATFKGAGTHVVSSRAAF